MTIPDVERRRAEQRLTAVRRFAIRVIHAMRMRRIYESSPREREEAKAVTDKKSYGRVPGRRRGDR